jgi:Protein kinase domain
MTSRVQVGQQLGNYRLLRQLGAGGFAEVYLAEHLYLPRFAAVKVLLMSLTGNDKESDSFLKEAQTMASLKHPHIVSCLDFGIQQNIPYLIMDYAPGGTLRDRHPEGEQVPLSTVVSYVEQMADALQYAHQHRTLHLDIKPENMLVGADGEILLSDFGLARLASQVSTRLTTLIGTISYMAPEHIRRKPQAASDQYALAMVIYEWLTGVRPFDSDDERIIAGQQLNTAPSSMRSIDPTLPASIDEVVLAALAKKPEDRYSQVSEFAEALATASTLTAGAKGSVPVPEKIENLYKEGLKAKGQGKLELAKQLLEELQARDPSYRQNVVDEQLRQIDITLYPQLLMRYRAEAEAANRAGQWDLEIDAWNGLLRLNPGRTDIQEVRTRIRLAQQHKLNDHLYHDAEQMVTEQNMDGAQQLLQQLYSQDQYYGDPGRLAEKAKVSVPSTYQQEQVQRVKEEARRDRHDKAQARQKARLAFTKLAYGEQLGKLLLIWVAWCVLVSSVGATVGTVTQSWLWALLALLIVATGSWGLGHRRVLALIPLIIVFAVILALTLRLTLSLARLDYAHPYPSPYSTYDFLTGKNVIQYHHLFLRRQLNFGLIWWTVISFVGVIIAFFLKPPYNRYQTEEREYYVYFGGARPLFFSLLRRLGPGQSAYLSIANLIWVTLGLSITGLILWALVAFIAGILGAGFSIFDVGANIAWLGAALGCALGIGVGSAIPIWWTAMRSFIEEHK